MAEHSIRPIGVDNGDVIVPEVRVAADGTAEVPSGPDLGFAVDLDYIESCNETVERIERKNERRGRHEQLKSAQEGAV
jgi:hypothetical protein